MTDRHRLTRRERRIVRLIAEGRPDAEIAVRLATNVAALRREIAGLVESSGLPDRGALAGLDADEDGDTGATASDGGNRRTGRVS